MSDDMLEKATRALREQTRDADEAAPFTRARVLSGVRSRRVRQRTRVAFLLPLAACFVAASAWGAATGKLGRAFQRVEQALGVSAPAPAPPGHAAKHAAAAGSALAGSAPAPEPVLDAPTSDAPTPVGALPASPPASAPPIAPTPAPSGSAADREPAYELYRAAHRAHFVEHDSAAALTAWDAYLSAAPNGQFALEARYNRALCLVKLGRTDEAKRALGAFADGRYGGYRKREAAALLAALAPASTE